MHTFLGARDPILTKNVSLRIPQLHLQVMPLNTSNMFNLGLAGENYSVFDARFLMKITSSLGNSPSCSNQRPSLVGVLDVNVYAGRTGAEGTVDH